MPHLKTLNKLWCRIGINGWPEAGLATQQHIASLVPGALLRANVDTGHPVAWGLPGTVSAMNVLNHAYAPGRQNGQIRPIVRYAAGPLSLTSAIRYSQTRFPVAGSRARTAP